MYKRLIIEYVSKLSLDDLKKYALRFDINLSDNETLDIYNYINNNYDNFLNGEIDLDNVIHDIYFILSNDNYEKVYLLYLKYKDKI